MKYAIVVLLLLATARALLAQDAPPDGSLPPVLPPPALPEAPPDGSLPPVLPPPALPEPAPAATAGSSRNFAGSVQLDYLARSRRDPAASQGLQGTTIELSLKLTQDFNEHVSSSVKICFACHGFEVGMAFFDLRARDELNVRVGRFTPAFGAFPLRHDPANHNTSDKPMPYDMGRMARLRDWNEGILPAPWVDNGIEVSGNHYFGGKAQIDYAVYAISGPKGDSDGVDLDFKQSRSPERYYTDNNAQPTLGARVAVTTDLADDATLGLGISGMGGRYDPKGKLAFAMVGADATLQIGTLFLRAEYLARWTQIALGDDPEAKLKYGPGSDGTYDDFTLKDGFVVELERRFGRLDAIARWDGLRRWGNVLETSELTSYSRVLRYTAAVAYRFTGSLRIKSSVELYDFTDFDDEVDVHLGLAGPF